MSSVDYTPVILAQLTDLQMRVTKQDATIMALKAEIERLTGRTVSAPDTMRTSVPLRSHEHNHRQQPDTRPTGRDAPRHQRIANSPTTGVPRTRPKIATGNDKATTSARPTMSLSDVLKSGERVTLTVHIGKDADGDFIDATAAATFDGTDLTVTECEKAESIIGMKSSKPGEILYKFIDELKKADHIKRTFTIAPWKLCFVVRDGVKQSLEDLRNTVG